MTEKSSSKKAAKTKSTVRSPQTEKTVALTVKIDQRMYVRLSKLRATKRRTAQEILCEALRAHLDEAGV